MSHLVIDEQTALAFDTGVRRDASIHAVMLFARYVPDLTPHLAYLMPVIVARGVAEGMMYDPEHQLFVHDVEGHDAFKRCVSRMSSTRCSCSRSSRGSRACTSLAKS